MADLEDKVFNKLHEFGLSRNGAKRLARVDGIDTFLNSKILPKNHLPKPLCLNYDPTDYKQLWRFEANERKELKDYLSHWIVVKDKPYTAAPVYYVLIKYCETKTQ